VAGGVGAAIRATRAERPGEAVEVEVDTLEQLDQALACGAEAILLDNMPPTMLRLAVARTAGRARLEASGGITLDTIRDVAETGVDAISVGALTHSVRALDIALEVTPSHS
jgi:nicotinate-nucleotide pyrophosphorylase (carboxylating)